MTVFATKFSMYAVIFRFLYHFKTKEKHLMRISPQLGSPYVLSLSVSLIYSAKYLRGEAYC